MDGDTATQKPGSARPARPSSTSYFQMSGEQVRAGPVESYRVCEMLLFSERKPIRSRPRFRGADPDPSWATQLA